MAFHRRPGLAAGCNRAAAKLKAAWKAPKAIFPFLRASLPRTFASWWSDLPSEFRLMLACLRLAPRESEIRQIAGLSRSGIAWPNFLNLVDRHRTAPLVCQNLSRHGNNIPSSVMSQLRSRFESNARQALANTAELLRLDKLFRENGIPFIILKGSVLASQVYGNLALRHAGDIDLLVTPEQVELADQLLQTNYRRILPNIRLTPAQHQRFIKAMHHFEYWQDQGNLRLELHWRPIHDLSPPALEVTHLLAGAEVATIAGSPLPTLSLPENILYLCSHGGAHFWFRLFWLVDLAEIIRQNRAIDWQQLTNWASANGLLPQLVLGVVLAHKILDAPLPEAIRTQAWRNSLVSYSAQVSCLFMLLPDPEDRPLALRFHLNICRLWRAHTLPEKLNVLQDILLGRDWMTDRLPDSLFFLSYIKRLPLWLQRHLSRWRNQMG